MKKILASLSLFLSLFIVSCSDDYNDLPIQRSASANNAAENVSTNNTNEEENNSDSIRIKTYNSNISGEMGQLPVRKLDISGEMGQLPVW